MSRKPPVIDTPANDPAIDPGPVIDRQFRMEDFVIDGIRNFALVEIIYAVAEIADALKELPEPLRRKVTTHLTMRRMQCPTAEPNITFLILDTVIRECTEANYAYDLGNFVDRNGNDLPW